MNLDLFFEKFDQFADAPDAVAKMREWVLKLAIRRVAARVREGGHHVPRADVTRRFVRGWKNFGLAYSRLADSWSVYDNSGSSPKLLGQPTGMSALVDREMTFQCQREQMGYPQDWTYHPILLSLCPLSTLWFIFLTVTQSWTTKSSEGSDKNLISVAFVEVGWAGSGWR